MRSWGSFFMGLFLGLSIGTMSTALIIAKPAPFDEVKFFVFYQRIDSFARELWGCPDGPVIYPKDCRGGVINYKKWRELQKQAKDVFGSEPFPDDVPDPAEPHGR